MSEQVVPAISNDEYSEFFRRIRAGDEDAKTELCRRLSRGLRAVLWNRLGKLNSDSDDIQQETLIAVMQAIENGDIETPAAVFGFARTIAIRKSGDYIARLTAKRRTETTVDDMEEKNNSIWDDRVFANPLKTFEQKQESQNRLFILSEALNTMGKTDAGKRNIEILRRFYSLNQKPAQIQHEMNLTETQYRLFKSRGLQELAKIARKKMGKPIKQEAKVSLIQNEAELNAIVAA